MILSTKKLRQLPDNQVWVCHAPACNSPAVFKDHEGEEAYCADHTLLEDLDPEWVGNQPLLSGARVSRRAALTWPVKFGDMFTPRPANQDRGQRGMWVSMPTGSSIKQNSADSKDVLTDWIKDNMIYGLDAPLDHNYYVQVTRKDDLAYIHLKYQQILGTRLLAIVEWDSVVEFFGERKK